MTTLRFLQTALIAGVCSAAALAADLTPSDILANPASFSGKEVSVAGKVTNFQTSKTIMGTVAGFQLCDAKCIVVIDERNTARSDGQTATVSGTFYETFKTRKRSFKDAVVIK